MVRIKRVKASGRSHSRKAGQGAAPTNPFDKSVQVFTLGEVAGLLQAPKSRITNWTIGRPLKIVPRVLSAQGKGSHNLFSLDDVYVLAFVNQLYTDGLSMSAIEYLVHGAFLGPTLGPVEYFEFRRGKGGRWGARFGTGEFQYQDVQPLSPSAVDVVAGVSPGKYTLNVKALVGIINSRIAALLKKRRQHGHIQEG
ncbi:MAG: hypothetical protein ABSD98_11635 [Candidatus Korobacteraceae bacterium]|jgi:hypothetical protein